MLPFAHDDDDTLLRQFVREVVDEGPDVGIGEQSDRVKDRCAQAHVPYDIGRITEALDAEVASRQPVPAPAAPPDAPPRVEPPISLVEVAAEVVDRYFRESLYVQGMFLDAACEDRGLRTTAAQRLVALRTARDIVWE